MSIFDFFKKKKNVEETEETEQLSTAESDISQDDISDESDISQDNLSDESDISQDDISDESDFSQDDISDENNFSQDDIADETDISQDNLSDESDISQDDIADETDVSQDDVTEENEEEKPKKQGFFAKIKSGLEKTRKNILEGVEQVLKGFSSIDEDLYEELEEALVMADIGMETSMLIIDKVREIVKAEKIKEVSEVRNVIIRVIKEMLTEDSDELELPSPTVILVIGVNGVGKTTTIGKLAHNYKQEGKKVILGAGDTFRAAAIDQLEVWGQRSDIPVIKHEENSDPASVIFDAVHSAKAKNADILICDTAGRLHNKKNLMEELKKIARVINREFEQAHVEVFLVLDSTTGQNALQQAKLFRETADITGIVLTKLDGTAKGGVVISIKNELKIPVRYIGVGEGIDDLQKFNAEDFAKALFE